MHDIPWLTAGLIFMLAGMVKGATGMGLPTVAIALLGLLMPLPAAAALLIMPSLVTNLMQILAGPALGETLRRLWPMLACTLAGTLAASGSLLANPQRATCALGAALALYALLALFVADLRIPPAAEKWLSPLAGGLTGLLTGATGVFVLPAVPYLQALGMEKAKLVQALGVSFTASTLALWAGLTLRGGGEPIALAASAWLTLPALAGMWVGQRAGRRLRPAAFRRGFLWVLLLLGLELGMRPLLG